MAIVDPKSGRQYYYNKVQKITTWTKPEGFVESSTNTVGASSAAAASAAAAKPALPSLPTAPGAQQQGGSGGDDDNPANWVEMVDKNTNRKYYYNRKTQKTTWHKPPCLAADPAATANTAAVTSSNSKTAAVTSAAPSSSALTPPPDALTDLPPGWSASVDANTGRTYWFNKSTRETTWHKPQAAKAVATPLAGAGGLPPVPLKPAGSTPVATTAGAPATGSPPPSLPARPTLPLPLPLPNPPKPGATPAPAPAPEPAPAHAPAAEAQGASAGAGVGVPRRMSVSTNQLAGMKPIPTAAAPLVPPRLVAEPEPETKAESSSAFIELDEEAERAMFEPKEPAPGSAAEQKSNKLVEDSDDDEEVIAARNRAKERAASLAKARAEAEAEGDGAEEDHADAQGETGDLEGMGDLAAQEALQRKMAQQEQTLAMFTNESDSDDDISTIRFAKHRKGLFARFFRTKSAIQGTDKILSFKKSLIRKALLKQNRELDAECIQNFKNIMSYMGDRSSSKGMIDHAKKMIRNLMIAPAGLRDEAYIQLCKQTNNHPKVENCTKGWELMSLCLASFPPSKTIRTFLLDYIDKTLENASLPPAIKDLARICKSQFDRIIASGQRKQVPSEREIEAIRRAEKVLVQIPFLSGSSQSHRVDSYTTVGELEEIICKELNLTFTEPFALFEVGAPGVERLLDRKERVLDVVASWEHDRPDSETCQVGSKHAAPYVSRYNRFLFKAKLVLKVNVPEVTADPVALNLLYIQAVNDVVSARYPVKDKHAIVLASLQLQASRGNMPEGYTADALCDVIHEYLPDGLVHNERHKIVRPLAMDYSHKVLAKWSLLKDFTDYESKLNYLQVVQDWTFYGATFFSVEQRQFKDYPEVFLVGITCEGILIMHPQKRTVLENYPYPDILTWGFSDEKFIITVGNMIQQRRLVFKTTEGSVMNSLVHDYVRFKVRARAAAAAAAAVTSGTNPE